MSQLLRIEEPQSRDPNPPSLRAFFELGFRPLYLAGAFWAAVAILIWIFFPRLLMGPMQGVVWHGHEMLWGFVVTIAVGFLMTAGANWTGLNPLPRPWLAAACGFWLAARLLYLLPSEAAFLLAALAETIFLAGAAVAMGLAVISTRSRRNYGVPVVLLGLAAVNLLFLWEAWKGDYETLMRYFSAGLMLMAMLVLLVGRRVIPFFSMRAVPGLEIDKHMRSGQVQLGLSVVAIAGWLLNAGLLTAALLAAIGLISIWQVLSWKPLAVRSRPILWVLYLGYLLTGLGLLAATAKVLDPGLRSAWFVHTIAMGGFSVLIIGMITRTALGHLGRPLKLSSTMVAAYWFVVAATALRLLALTPTPFSVWVLHLSALCWIAAFAFYVWEFFPMMIRPRSDIVPVMPTIQKPH